MLREREQLQSRLRRVPRLILSDAGVQTIRQYKEWIKDAKALIGNRNANAFAFIPLINQYDIWDKEGATNGRDG